MDPAKDMTSFEAAVTLRQLYVQDYDQPVSDIVKKICKPYLNTAREVMTIHVGEQDDAKVLQIIEDVRSACGMPESVATLIKKATAARDLMKLWINTTTACSPTHFQALMPATTIYQKAVSLVGDGSETTDSALGHVLFQVLADPAVYTRLRHEIASAASQQPHQTTDPNAESAAHYPDLKGLNHYDSVVRRQSRSSGYVYVNKLLQLHVD
ncbi:uncharacterized protein HMPREF1541_09029 [Cyphellophora europaea CBS 101466]|uniref:Uncharacterized protein n=1 Tax=Cyphellophora europaea (strain CBS 101466) TaxID=1220924 RepID=W2RJU8_CYPE1|nr:uncharacterized protein HMPREF1541_09029 [Cyphellophora europaea CBS 101466]ETN36751.1 hypothetical protein HMPREF1541_09029 [Cyphellophora europaea CBS 101466]